MKTKNNELPTHRGIAEKPTRKSPITSSCYRALWSIPCSAKPGGSCLPLGYKVRLVFNKMLFRFICPWSYPDKWAYFFHCFYIGVCTYTYYTLYVFTFSQYMGTSPFRAFFKKSRF